jgi:hypothetical protein
LAGIKLRRWLPATLLGVFVALVVQVIGAELGYRSIEVLLSLVVGGAVAARSARASNWKQYLVAALLVAGGLLLVGSILIAIES